MENMHILEKNLKTINGQTLLGDGDISVVPVSVDASTITEEQLNYIRDRQMSYGSWSAPSITNFVVTPQVTKLPIFNTKKIGNLVASTEDTFLLKKNRVYKIEVSFAFNGLNGNNVRFGIYNNNTNTIIGNINLIQPPTNTANLLYESFISEYVRVEVDTPISVRMFNNYGGQTDYTVSALNTGTKINIMEISTTDMVLSDFSINGKKFDSNNNIDLEGLSTLSNPKLNVEVLTEKRHPVSQKPIYLKTIDFGFLPNTAIKNVAHTITNYDYIGINLEYSYIYMPGISGFSFTGAHGIWNNKTYDIGSYIDGPNISLATGMDRTNMKAYITVEYTKTTDTAESPVRLVGGGFKYTESNTEPNNPSLGDEWHNTTNDILYKRRKKNGILGWYEI